MQKNFNFTVIFKIQKLPYTNLKTTTLRISKQFGKSLKYMVAEHSGISNSVPT